MQIKRKLRFISIIIIVILLLYSGTLSVIAITSPFRPSSSHIEELKKFLQEVNKTAIMKHINFFEGLGNRRTGYNGCREAAEYIHNYFNNYLTNVSYHTFKVLVPIIHEASLRVVTPSEIEFKIHPLEPNLVTPPTTPKDGITAELVYVGKGSFQELDGKDIKGKILLMDFNSHLNWLLAAAMGAKAVIFIEPYETTITESELKRVDQNLKFPRFYIRREDANQLLSLMSRESVTVNLVSKVVWEEAEGRNIIGYLKGEKLDRVIFFTAPYDSRSVVLSIAPGSEEATGIASLLEMIRVFAEQARKGKKPEYTLGFIAFSGSDNGLAGARNFWNDHLFGKANDDFSGKTLLEIDLYPYSQAKTIVPIIAGGFDWFREYEKGSGYKNLFSYIISVAEDVKQSLNLEIEIENKGSNIQEMTLSTEPFQTGVPPMNFEALTASGGPGLAFVGGDVWRRYWQTPLDTSDRINQHNLFQQILLIYAMSYAVAYTANLEEKYLRWVYLNTNSWARNVRSLRGAGGVEGRGWPFMELSGTAGVWNETKAWYQPLPNALVVFTKTNKPGATIVTKTDVNGTFKIFGYAEYGYEFNLRIFVIDPESGDVIYAPDAGRHAYNPPGCWNPPGWGRFTGGIGNIGWYALFKCSSIVLFDTFNPRSMQWESPSFIVNDFLTHTPVDSYSQSFLSEWSQYQSIENNYQISFSIVYLPPEKNVEIVGKIRGRIFMVLINATQQNPEGAGYILKPGEQRVLLPLRYAENFYWINQKRIRISKIHDLRIPKMERHVKVERLLNEAYEDLKEPDLKYSEAYAKSIVAWSIALELYEDLRSTIVDAVNTIPFFGFILIPFIFLFESLIFTFRGKKKIFALTTIYIIILIILGILHPAFSLAANIFMDIIGFSILILLAPVIVIMSGRVWELFKYLRIKILGKHFIERAPPETLISAWNLGIGNLKRRKLRSALTQISIIMIVLALVSFTSIKPITTISWMDMPRKPSYNGFFIKRTDYGQVRHGLGLPMLRILEGLYGKEAIVSGRMWIYPQLYGPIGRGYYRVYYNSKEFRIRAFLGLSYKESAITGIDMFIKTGRWFVPPDRWVCIIGSNMADYLGIKEVPAQINIIGVNFTVVGIIDSDYFAFKDLDMQEITPLTLDLPVEVYIYHFSVDEIIIIPFDTALSLGAYARTQYTYTPIASLSLAVTNQSWIKKIAAEISTTFPNLEYYIGMGERGFLISPKTAFTIMGLQYQLVLIILASLVILNVMLGSVYERTREIEIYNVVGISPSQISALFLSESSVHAIVGGVIGYVVALLFLRINIIVFGGALILNYSSMWVITSVGIAMAMVLLSSIYPAYKASKLVTPSLERTWTIPTKPVGDIWEIPIPIASTTEEEAGSIIAYIYEYAEAHRGASAETFSVEDIWFNDVETAPRRIYSLILNTTLIPYDLGIRQTVEINMMMDTYNGKWKPLIRMKRIAGPRSSWITSNRIFIDAIRKQFIFWRLINPDERKEYREKFKEIREKLKRVME